MRNRFIALSCALASTALAQTGGYLGPGVLSRGAGEIGNRGGQQLNLRFFAEASAMYDSGLLPYKLDDKGNLLRVGGLYGVRGAVGVYGSHQWRKSLLGLEYGGDFNHFDQATSYDGSTNNLILGYTYQKSRRLSFDMRQLAGTSSRSYGGAGFFSSIVTSDLINQPTSLLFDNRTYYVQSTVDVNLIATARTIFTFGGDGYTVQRQAKGLAGVNGYDLRGGVQRRLSKIRTIGVTYQHTHYDFPPAFGEADIDNIEGFFSTALGRRWTFSIHGGGFLAQVQGIQQVALDPVIAALLGQGAALRAFSRRSIYPSGHASLNGRYRTYTLEFDYERTVTPGDGVYLASRQESGTAYYSFTGIRKWNFGLRGGYYKLSSIGQGIQPYSQSRAGAGITYGLTRAIHLVANYDLRHQAISEFGYRRTSYAATLGLAFSPGDKPLSLW